jgi:hypothetical protein
MQTSIAPPEPVRANGHPVADGRKRQSQSSPKPLTSLYLAQPSALARQPLLVCLRSFWRLVGCPFGAVFWFCEQRAGRAEDELFRRLS